MRLGIPAPVWEPPAPRSATMPPTTPLRSSTAPNAVSIPISAPIQLVPRSASEASCAVRGSSVPSIFSQGILFPSRGTSRPALPVVTFGVLLDVDLFLAHVFLDHFLVLDDLLADPDLLPDHRPLLDHDFFLDHGHPDLVVPNLRLNSLLVFDRRPLDACLLALLGYLNPLAVPLHPLANPQAAGLAIAGAGPEFLLAPLHHELVPALGRAALAVSFAPSRTGMPLIGTLAGLLMFARPRADLVITDGIRIVRVVGS